MVPADSTDAYQTARRSAAMLDRSDRGRLVVAGRDRATYLHGLLTNDVAALKPGEGCYAAYLTPQGRMIADLFVYELGDAILLNVDGSVKDTVLAKLDQFIFTEEVTLGDVTATFAQLAVVGPDAAKIVAGVLGADAAALTSLPVHGNQRGAYGGQSAIVTHVTDLGEPGFDLYVDRAQASQLMASLASAGVATLGHEAAEALRIEAGVPAFRRDMDEDTIPLEAGIEPRAISFTKGCYVGQEVIIRVLHRGHGRVARKLVGLALEGGVAPASGTPVFSGDREVGHVTSATMSPALSRPIALAYLHRDYTEPGTAVKVGHVAALVSAVPFVHQ